MPRPNSRATVIDACQQLIEREGFAATSISAIATAAGVSRQTIYSLFGSREDLVSQTVLTAFDEVLATTAAATAPTAGTVAYIVELLVVGRRETLRQPVCRELLRAEQNNPLFDQGMMERALPVIAALLEPVRARDPHLADAETFAQLTELVTRLGISTLVFDSPLCRDEPALRRFLTRALSSNLTQAE
ncbi:MAG: TetR/AcrR family transcriptional regulator [Solirubrobacterales bacterium]|nr:TetR/AcrR family transcriptional regulator [Solirubrobacterales bacterium]